VASRQAADTVGQVDPNYLGYYAYRNAPVSGRGVHVDEGKNLRDEVARYGTVFVQHLVWTICSQCTSGRVYPRRALATAVMNASSQRFNIHLSGIVQGVGMRPFIWQLAHKHHLCGYVSNDLSGVHCEIEGGATEIDNFLSDLKENLPPRAHIESIEVREIATVADTSFTIRESSQVLAPGTLPVISPDIATCDFCLAELFDPTNRRYLHPFITCTQCGPRLTISTDSPWDRANTTMSTFSMCDDCLSEYESPNSRRYHAETISCHKCGPRLSFRSSDMPISESVDDPISLAAAAIKSGEVVAVKGVGGFHLVCRPDRDEAVAKTRRAKRRPAQPFALMVASLNVATKYALLDKAASTLLAGWDAPIVLLQKGTKSRVSSLVAPKLCHVGLMLPYSPVYHLLFAQLSPELDCLLVTSANRSGRPLIADTEGSRSLLLSLADGILDHDRHIAQPVDDAVVSYSSVGHTAIRLGRGSLPLRLPLRLGPSGAENALIALGGDQKCVVAIAGGGEAVAVARIGSVDNSSDERRLSQTVRRVERLYRPARSRLVADLHPRYVTRRWAERRATEPLFIQHHMAHIATVLAERPQPAGVVIGVAFDGFGYGNDGVLRGGELMLFEIDSSGRMRPTPVGGIVPYRLPRTDLIARRPDWTAFSIVMDMGDTPVREEFGLASLEAEALATMLGNPERTILSTSVGRIFDAVSAMLGVCLQSTYEGQAPAELEALAGQSVATDVYPFGIVEEDSSILIDVRPCLRAIRQDQVSVSAASIAHRFHRTLAAALVAACIRVRQAYALPSGTPVAMGGGVFVNSLLRASAMALLLQHDFIPLLNSQLPSNDEGLPFGQLAMGWSSQSGE
jgi:hydrogenase maturation protein HypF